MKFASSATLLLAAALSTLSAAQTTVIAQGSAKTMIVKPGGLITVTQELVFSEDFRRKVEASSYPFYIECWAGYDYNYDYKGESTNKDGTANPDKRDKRDKRDETDNDKPDKAARPGGKLNLFFEDEDIILLSASIKPNNFQPRVVADSGDFAEDGIVYFPLPLDGITQLKTYTATYKFRLGDDWTSGEIVPFSLWDDINRWSLVNVIVR